MSERSVCSGVDDGRSCSKSRDHNGPCRFRGLRDSAKRRRALDLLLSRSDLNDLQDLASWLRGRKEDKAIRLVELAGLDVIERLLGRPTLATGADQ